MNQDKKGILITNLSLIAAGTAYWLFRIYQGSPDFCYERKLSTNHTVDAWFFSLNFLIIAAISSFLIIKAGNINKYINVFLYYILILASIVAYLAFFLFYIGPIFSTAAGGPCF